MEGLLDRIRSFFTGINKILPLKGTTHVRILDSNGLIDESLQQAVEEEPKIILREAVAPDVAVPAVTKKALTELE